jgi:hypothetical protein
VLAPRSHNTAAAAPRTYLGYHRPVRFDRGPVLAQEDRQLGCGSRWTVSPPSDHPGGRPTPPRGNRITNGTDDPNAPRIRRPVTRCSRTTVYSAGVDGKSRSADASRRNSALPTTRCKAGGDWYSPTLHEPEPAVRRQRTVQPGAEATGLGGHVVGDALPTLEELVLAVGGHLERVDQDRARHRPTVAPVPGPPVRPLVPSTATPSSRPTQGLPRRGEKTDAGVLIYELRCRVRRRVPGVSRFHRRPRPPPGGAGPAAVPRKRANPGGFRPASPRVVFPC